MDSQRLEKGNKVPFPVTETQEFHELLEQAGKAPELDHACYKSMQQILVGCVKMVTTLIVLVRVDVETGILLILFLLAGVWINSNAAKKTDGFWSEYMKNMRRANYLSSLLLYREYSLERKLFDYDREIEDRYEHDFSGAVAENRKLGKSRLRAETVVTMFSAVYSMAAILLLVCPLQSGQISPGMFCAAFSAANQLRNVGSQIYDGVFTYLSSFRQLSGFFSFIQLEEETPCPLEGDVDFTAGIEFSHVSFIYPGSNVSVLNDVSFILHPGEHYALVGENGCGKTTLVKLLLGLYQPTQGRILVGGKEIGSMSGREKQGLFSVMFQDFYRYPISVRENISLSSKEVPKDEQMRSILDTLGLKTPAICEEQGLDRSLMHLKSGGIDLSGGEWQKITAARCMMSSSPIAILDEPNAALDPMSEANFYQVCKELLANKTTLFISHRLGAVKQSDQILVLQGGQLIAMGSHEFLMENCGYYANLFETQRGLYYET
jgi:ATP-binding cassette subfamily B protein